MLHKNDIDIDQAERDRRCFMRGKAASLRGTNAHGYGAACTGGQVRYHGRMPSVWAATLMFGNRVWRRAKRRRKIHDHVGRSYAVMRHLDLFHRRGKK